MLAEIGKTYPRPTTELQHALDEGRTRRWWTPERFYRLPLMRELVKLARNR